MATVTPKTRSLSGHQRRAVERRRPDLPGTSPGQATKDMLPSGSRPRNGAATARANVTL